MAHVAFKQPIPETNLARSLQTRKQVMYLWELIDTLQPERDKTEEFKVLHQAVYNEFLAKGLLIVEHSKHTDLSKLEKFKSTHCLNVNRF